MCTYIWRIIGTTALMIAAAACSDSAVPQSLAFSAPDGLIAELDRPEWGPLDSWDSSLYPASIAVGDNGLLIHAKDFDGKDDFLITHDGETAWGKHRVELESGEVSLHVTRDTFVAVFDKTVQESSDGTDWQTSVELSNELPDGWTPAHISQSAGSVVVEFIDDAQLLDIWKSDSFGAWDRADIEQFATPLIDDDSEAIFPVASLPGQFDDEHLTLYYRREYRRQGPPLGFHNGTEWTLRYPFATEDDEETVRVFLHAFWSASLDQYVAVGSAFDTWEDGEMLYVSTSSDGDDWTVHQQDLAGAAAHRLFAWSDDGYRLFAYSWDSGQTLGYSTTDLETWTRRIPLDQANEPSRFLVPIGAGLCVQAAGGYQRDGHSLFSGPCPI